MDGSLLSPLLLSRIQFGFVISCHILFPAFTIGLASWLAFIEWRWLRTRDALWRDLYFFWVKIFAVSFGMAHRRPAPVGWRGSSVPAPTAANRRHVARNTAR